jgi:5,10-methylenetetrahydrofolate reductase
MDILIEITTPPWPDTEGQAAGLKRFDEFKGIVIAENGGISAPVFARNLARTWEKEILLKISCRDRNRIAIRSELATCAEMGLTSIVLADGEHPVHTPYPAAKPVYDLDILSFLRMMNRDSHCAGPSLDLGGALWNIGVCVGGSSRADLERVKRFLNAGADMFFVRSSEAAALIRNMTDKHIFLSVSEKEVSDVDVLLNQAESAGASGINILVSG